MYDFGFTFAVAGANPSFIHWYVGLIMCRLMLVCFTVDYGDLSAIALDLYTAGINKVSSTVMVESALNFDRNAKILRVSNLSRVHD